MLQAMNTGHCGSMSTGHANGPEDMMVRLETMVLLGIQLFCIISTLDSNTIIDIGSAIRLHNQFIQ